MTAEQIRDVAKKYLLDEHKTVAELIPQSVEAKGSKQKTTPAS